MDSNVTEKSYTRPLSADSSDDENMMTTENSKDEEQIKAYVMEFKKEVETKFSKSQVNAGYKFQRKRVTKSKHSIASKIDSFDSLENASYYDLEAQNVKTDLMETLGNNKMSETDIIVEVIKKMGKLDERYLRTQFSNIKSPFFKMLYNTINRKLQKDSITLQPTEPKKLSSRVKQKSFKVNQNTNFQKSFNICLNSEKNETTKKTEIPINSTKFINKISYFIQPNQSQDKKEKKTSVISRNVVKNKTLNSSMSPRNKNDISMGVKRKNTSLKQTKVSKREISGESHKSKHTTNSIVQKLKKNVIANNINISQITTTKNNIVNNINCNSKIPSRNHITLTKDQLTSLIQKNLYSKASTGNEKRSLSKKSSSKSVRSREGTIIKKNENVFQYATARPTSKHMETLKNVSRSRLGKL